MGRVKKFYKRLRYPPPVNEQQEKQRSDWGKVVQRVQNTQLIITWYNWAIWLWLNENVVQAWKLILNSEMDVTHLMEHLVIIGGLFVYE